MKTEANKTPSQRALEHFDQYFKPVYDKKWPSLRVALLSQNKYGALLNSFSTRKEELEEELLDAGAQDIVKLARDTQHSDKYVHKPVKNINEAIDQPEVDMWASRLDQSQLKLGSEGPGTQGFDERQVASGTPSLHDFIPASRVLSEREDLVREEQELSVYRPALVEAQVVVDQQELRLPHHLTMFTYPKSDTTMFKAPTTDASKLLGNILEPHVQYYG